MRPQRVTNFRVVEIFGRLVTILSAEADMKRLFFWLFFIALVALNWAALHDILKGEQDVWTEWTFVIASALLLLAYLSRKLRKARMH